MLSFLYLIFAAASLFGSGNSHIDPLSITNVLNPSALVESKSPNPSDSAQAKTVHTFENHAASSTNSGTQIRQATIQTPVSDTNKANKVIKPTPVPQPDKATTPTQKVSLPTQACNPNYSGCLKSNAGDYDCAGGSGNGPNYTGKVQVIGVDEYGLDRDGDGWGCD